MTIPPDWWEHFFEGLIVDFWRAAMTPEATRAEADFFEKRLRVPAGARLLDIPCGDGRMASELARRGYGRVEIVLSDLVGTRISGPVKLFSMNEVAMKRLRSFRLGLVVAMGILFGASARAQVVPLARCHAALPCSIPFAVQSRPDPLLAGQYGGPGNTGLLVAVPLRLPLTPRFEAPPIGTKTPEVSAALDAALRRSQARPLPNRKNAEPGTAPLPNPDQSPPDRAVPDPEPAPH